MGGNHLGNDDLVKSLNVSVAILSPLSAHRDRHGEKENSACTKRPHLGAQIRSARRFCLLDRNMSQQNPGHYTHAALPTWWQRRLLNQMKFLLYWLFRAL